MMTLMEQTPAVAIDELAATVASLAAGASLEIGADAVAEVSAVARVLPVGTRVFVNHSPRRELADSLPALTELHRCGLEPVPHVAARRVASPAQVRTFLERAVAECGVTKVLLVGGDASECRGPYDSGAALLRDRVLAQCGIREVGVPGYPEGHPWIANAVLKQTLVDKLALAADQGLGSFMVTQFTFAPARVVEFCAELARRIPSLPVYVGIAGPTDAGALLRFARRCGVSASLRALKDQGMNAVRLVTHTDPGEQLAAVARYYSTHAACNVVGVHLFSFGGALRSARWIGATITSGLGEVMT
jgi:methylenetetrahydrofolate reductase (NADPH)